MSNPNPAVDLRLPLDVVNVVLAALGERPLKETLGAFTMIQSQAQQSVREQEEPSATEEAT